MAYTTSMSLRSLMIRRRMRRVPVLLMLRTHRTLQNTQGKPVRIASRDGVLGRLILKRSSMRTRPRGKSRQSVPELMRSGEKPSR